MLGEPLQVLLVEDNAPDVIFVSEALKEAPGSEFQLTHAKRLHEAFRCLQAQEFDVVLLDLGLPDSQGLDTFIQLQAHSPKVPILILSSLDNDGIGLKAVMAGAQDVLVKGVMNGRALALTIRYAIERVRASADVTASEASFRRLFETSQDGIFILDAKTGQITDSNPFVEKLLGHSVDEFIGKRLWEIAPFRERAASHVAFLTLREKGRISYHDIPLRTRDGHTVTVEFVSNIYDVGDKQVIQCNIHDITARRSAEAELHRVNEELEQKVNERTHELSLANVELQEFIDAMSTLAVKVSPDGEFLIVNRVALEASGLSREHIMKTNFLEGVWWAFDPEVQSRVKQSFKQALSGESVNYNERIFAFGRAMTINFSLVPVRDASGAIGYVIAEGSDITELMKTETALHQAKGEAERANLAKSEFLSRMSHELRTPLNAILGFSQILDMEVSDTRLKESVGHILKGGRHLLGLINEVLDLARVEAGSTDLSIEPIDVLDLIHEAFSLVKPLAGDQDIRLLEIATCENRPFAMADAQRLKQVLINLLSNAIKYNRQGGEVEIGWSTASNNHICIHVRDTGLGIRQEDMGKLFTPFERLSYSHSTIQGTGLGLALSKRLVDAMGGRIFVASTPNMGSTFSVELSAAKPIQLMPINAVVEYIEPAREFEGLYTILAIEDNVSNLRLLEAILERRPEISLLSAMQGSVGLDLAVQFTPDLILLDLNLPDMTGMQILARLRNSEVTRSIPVIIVSADATTSQIERLLHAGAVDYLTKPFEIQHFLKLLDDQLPHTQATPVVEVLS